MSVFFVTQTYAHDHDHPELNSWYMSLRNTSGTPCCDTSDVHAISVDEWKTENGGYKVLIDNLWVSVPGNAVLDKEPNKAGRALLWMRPTWNGFPEIYCFMPGPMT